MRHACPREARGRIVFGEGLRKNNPHLLLAVRTREVLEWHFKYPLRNDQVWILTAGANPITAYPIFLRYDNPAARLTRMRLIDFQALDGSTALLAPRLAWALERCRREGIHMFESIGFCPEKMRVINELSPYGRKLPCWMFFYKTPHQKLAEKLADPSAWDPSQFGLELAESRTQHRAGPTSAPRLAGFIPARAQVRSAMHPDGGCRNHCCAVPREIRLSDVELAGRDG
jgi:hypothetical protein